MLAGRQGHDDVVIRGARVLDPVEGVDATMDVRIDGGTIAQLGDSLEGNGHRVVEGAGLTLVPAFVDPHVEDRVDPLRRVEHARAADDEVVARPLLHPQHHATSTAVSTSTGPVVSRS